ncbi:MAG TPA: DUF2807 domain-containing protein [Telmatospirillum sp.]|nr:DUF2807 domain-containing protein [Telmatospirillum sp.]
MSRPLIIVAVVGLALSAVSLTLAGALSSRLWDDAGEILNNLPGGSRLTLHFNEGRRRDDCSVGSGRADSTLSRRDLTWPDGETSLALDIPARLHYRPGAPRQMVIEGRGDVLNHLKIEEGHVFFDCPWAKDIEARDLISDITLGGVSIESFEIHGIGQLDLEGVSQPSLAIDVTGAGTVAGGGVTDQLDLAISGTGRVDLGKLVAKSADVTLSGASEARLAVRNEADVTISGTGLLLWTLLPAKLESHVSGRGRIGKAEER